MPPDHFIPASDSARPAIYQIRVEGHLDPQWADWFDQEISITLEAGHTVLVGPLIDQAALYGVLKLIRNVGLKLVSVNPQ